ncbi:hypothetical protein CDAR_70781 [Caerostris darwini]|uniref:Uncharacterized protein n=1 Tax=Caerostris darwini TaxID=1538125 RepID=A0AAV4WEH9_9ARAC|nr:hypothetical protein CDAR_70781 [Caerostris darwini]
MTLPPNHPLPKGIGGRCISPGAQCLPIRRYSRFHFSDGRRKPVRLLAGAANGKISPTSAPGLCFGLVLWIAPNVRRLFRYKDLITRPQENGSKRLA